MQCWKGIFLLTLWFQLEDMFQLIVTPQGIEKVMIQLKDTYTKAYAIHQWLFQISMKLPLAKIELGPIYDRLVQKFLFSGLKMRLAGL